MFYRRKYHKFLYIASYNLYVLRIGKTFQLGRIKTVLWSLRAQDNLTNHQWKLIICV